MIWVVTKGATPDHYYGTRIVAAKTAQDAAEAFTATVADLRAGLLLRVQPWEPTHAFWREYADKGGPGGGREGDWPLRPLTFERPDLVRSGSLADGGEGA